MSIESFELPFLAPVPFGHDVLVVFARTELSLARLVLDETTHVLYCEPRLWGALGTNLRATVDPIGALAGWKWTIERTLRGRSAGAMIAPGEQGVAEIARTRLFVEAAPTTPFR